MTHRRSSSNQSVYHKVVIAALWLVAGRDVWQGVTDLPVCRGVLRKCLWARRSPSPGGSRHGGMGSPSDASQATTESPSFPALAGATSAHVGSALNRGWPIPRFVLAAVIFGLVCRLSQYAANTSLWHDEALVALNVLHKSFIGLLGPLEWNEAAPPGFLVVEKLVVSFLGRSEHALRLVPLLAGLAGMTLFACLARRVCGTGAAWLWSVLLMAASSKLIVQSNEVKHFTLDLLWAVLVSWLAVRIWHLRKPGRDILIWGALGAAGLWISFASVFVFAGTSLALLPRAVQAWRWRERTVYLAANVIVLVSLGLLSGPIQAQRTGTVVEFWAKSFPDTNSLPALVYWLGRSHLRLFNYFWQPFGVVLLSLGVLGSVRCWRTGRQPELLLISLPVCMALAASFLQRWPFGGNQHMVFAAPMVYLIVAEGIEALRHRLVIWRPSVAWLFVGVLLLPGLLEATYRIGYPRLRHEVRPVVEFVQRYRQPGDQFLVFDPATVEFYAGCDLLNTPGELNASNRVWFIASGSRRKGFPAPTQEVLDRLSDQRLQLRTIEEHGAVAYLFGPARSPGEPRLPYERSFRGGGMPGDARR